MGYEINLPSNTLYQMVWPLELVGNISVDKPLAQSDKSYSVLRKQISMINIAVLLVPVFIFPVKYCPAADYNLS